MGEIKIKRFMLCNEAIARGCLEAGLDFATGYPGTPSSEVIDTLNAYHDRNFYVEWSVNEKVALENAIGASWCGLRSICVMKHVGLNVAADPFMSLAYTGVKGGLVVLSADDPFPHSSQNEQDSRRYAHAAKIPCLDPSTPQEAKDMVKYAFCLSERHEIPVMLRPTTRICHARSDIEIDDIPKESRRGRFVKDPKRWVLVPAHAKELHKKLNEKQEKIIEDLSSTPFNYSINRGETAIISSGVASAYAHELIPDGVSFMKIGTYPIDLRKLKAFTERHKKILVIEELDPVLEEAARMVSSSEIIGKMTGDVPLGGELNLNIVHGILEKNGISPKIRYEERDPEEGLPKRPPSLCAGCMHQPTLYAIEEVFKGDIYPSDIGCYTLSAHAIDTCLCMGSSVSIGSGISHCEGRNVVVTIGDSTFMHTGIPGLINAVYNDAKMVLVILDNRTTAMTGHQPSPGTGENISGTCKELSLEAICRACGADLVETVDPYDFVVMKEALHRAKAKHGVRVIIARHPCAIIEKRRKGEEIPFEIDVKRCTKCGDCLDYGCPAIELYDIKPIINDLCNGCGICSVLCSSGAITRRKER
jgi:indolepyruvate ferredoxin oxidoreductase, alpha subunit